MTGIASTMAFALALVFAVAATSKALNPKATSREFSQLKVPAPQLVARMIPVVELATVAGLLLRPRYGAVVAVILLVSFTVVIAASLHAGRSVSCGCLGALSQEPISHLTVVRNVGLIAMAVAASATSSLSWPDAPSAMAALSAMFLGALVLHLVGLRQEIGRIWSVELAGESDRVSNQTTPDMKGMTI